MVDVRLIPKTESLKDTKARILPFWYDIIVPEIKVRTCADVHRLVGRLYWLNYF